MTADAQQHSIFYAGEFCHSDSLHLLLLVTAWYYLRPRMYMKSEKQAIVTKIKCDPNITWRIWNLGGWTGILLLTTFDIPTVWERVLLENLQVAVDFPSCYVPCTMVNLIKKIPTMCQTSPATTFHSPIKALFQYYSTVVKEKWFSKFWVLV